MNLFFNFIKLILLFFYSSLLAEEINLNIINEETVLIIKSNNIKVFVDDAKNFDEESIFGRIDLFKKINKNEKLNHKKAYWVTFLLKNNSKYDKELSISPVSRWNLAQTSIIKMSGEIIKLADTGFFRSTFTSFHDKKLADINNFKSKYPVYKIYRGETIRVISRLTFYQSLPPNSFNFSIKNHSAYLESRKFDLHLQGILSGILIALLILSLYTYINFKTTTNLLYSNWLFVSTISCLNMPVHGGQNLTELYLNLGQSTIFGMNISLFISVLFNYASIYLYIIFARSFLEIKNANINGYNLINFGLILLLISALLVQFWTPIAPIYFFFISSVIVFSIYFYLLFIAFQKYKLGSVVYKYFLIAFSCYVILRVNFILAVIGIKSPIELLDSNRFGLFISDGRIFQLFSITLEAIFMSLVLVVRSKITQDNLNANIQKQAVEAEKQQVVLEETVKERTSELEEKSTALEGVSNQLAKYIPPQIHDALFAGKYDTEIKTQRRKLTVFFSDIKNFTSTSENLQPEDLTKYLNEYFSEMTKIAIDHGATIDKYIGDAMMVFFGDPETKGEREDARACVEMALKMQERMGQLREKWLNEGFADPFEVRIGINTGYCNVGNFGSDQRLTYTIIGGEVNVAARLESAAQANGILMSYETYAHVQDMVEVEQKEAIKMKGINREIKIYAVEGRKEVVKTKAKVTKAKKPTKKELTKIEQLEKESKELREELKLIKIELKNFRK